MQRAFSFHTRFGTGWLHFVGEQLICTVLPSPRSVSEVTQSKPQPATLETYLSALVDYFDRAQPLACPCEFFDQGTLFRQQVYRIVAAIPWGESQTYSQVAAQAGSPGAARAVGSAMAKNRFAPFIPCHRVVPAAGGIGQYGGGVALKRALLEMERQPRR